MRQILHEKKQQIQNVAEFRHVLKHERIPIDRIPVTIIACTGKYQNSKLESNNMRY